MCLEECLRVLKPGGYLEFFIFDSDIIKPGPLGTEFSIKFAEELEANGYDPSPSRKWIHRLNKTGFGDIKRAWVFVPMAPQVKPKPPAKEDEYEVVKRTPSQEHLEAMKEEVRKKMEAWEDLGVKKGSTENAAPVSGLLGSWVWERWMLKTRQETQHATQWELAVDTMGAVLEEGKERGSGWRALVGWARKPLIAPHSHRFQFGARSRAVSGESMFAVKR